jgi:hypothetical protein
MKETTMDKLIVNIKLEIDRRPGGKFKWETTGHTPGNRDDLERIYGALEHMLTASRVICGKPAPGVH